MCCNGHGCPECEDGFFPDEDGHIEALYHAWREEHGLPPDSPLDDVTELAAHIPHAPLTDDDRRWWAEETAAWDAAFPGIPEPV
jgi:hypothetical protein